MTCKIVLPCNEIFKLASFPKSYSDLLDAVKCRIRCDCPLDFQLKYMDADKELVNLSTTEDLETAILSNEAEQVKTLKVYVLFQNSKNSQKEGARKQQISADVVLEHQEKSQNNQIFFNSDQFIRNNQNSSISRSSQVSTKNNHGDSINSFLEDRVKEIVEENMQTILPQIVKKRTQIHNRQYFGASNQQNWNLSKSDVPQSSMYSMPASLKIHTQNGNPKEICSECKQAIQINKYICLECPDYACCEDCEHIGGSDHALTKSRVSSSYCPKANRQNHSPPFKFNLQAAKGRLSVQKASHRQSLNEGMNENKKYAGEIIFEHANDQKIKVGPASGYSISIVVKNTGEEAWPEGVRLSCVNGTYRSRQETLEALSPGAQQTLNLGLISPTKPGKYLSQWRIYYDEEKERSFGESLFLDIRVDKKLSGVELQNETCQSKENQLEARPSSSVAQKDFAENYSISSNHKKQLIANYLDEIFPGNKEEKVDFVENLSEDEFSLPKVVELYLNSLKKYKSPRSCQILEATIGKNKMIALTSSQ